MNEYLVNCEYTKKCCHISSCKRLQVQMGHLGHTAVTWFISPESKEENREQKVHPVKNNHFETFKVL